MLSPYSGSHLKDAYLNMIGRLNSHDRAIYDHFYDSLSLDFEKRHLTGRALTEFKFQRYMRDYAKVVKNAR